MFIEGVFLDLIGFKENFRKETLEKKMKEKTVENGYLYEPLSHKQFQCHKVIHWPQRMIKKLLTYQKLVQPFHDGFSHFRFKVQNLKKQQNSKT